MIPKIKNIKPIDGFMLQVIFDDGKIVIYNVEEDIESMPSYQDLKTIHGLFKQAQVDESRTCVFWNDMIDIPSDTIYEYGVEQRNL